MKKNILILTCLAAFAVSCQKEDDSLNSTNPSGVGSTAPIDNNAAGRTALFTKRVLVEEFVGTSYGDVPEVSRVLNSIVAANPSRVIVASHHNNDILEIPQTDILVNALTSMGSTAYPSSLINRDAVNGFRFVGSPNYQSAISQELIQGAQCGISITSTLTKRKATIDVYEGFSTTIPSACNINVYLVENNVNLSSPANYQANNFNNTPKSPFYNMGNPMSQYTHQHVMRACITPSMGSPIKQSAIVSGGNDHQTFSYLLPENINPNNCYIIAFITKNNGGIASQVLNCQTTQLGTIGTW